MNKSCVHHHDMITSLKFDMSTSGDEYVCTTTHMWCIVCIVLWYYPSIDVYSTYVLTHDHSNVCSATRYVQTMTCHDLGWYHDLEMVPSRNRHIVCHYSRSTCWVSPWPDHITQYCTVIPCITRIRTCKWWACVTLCIMIHTTSGLRVDSFTMVGLGFHGHGIPKTSILVIYG